MRLISIAVSAGPMHQRETGVFVPYRGCSPLQFPGCLRETIHPHTCIRNEIISLPPWALISQPPAPGWAPAMHRGGRDAEMNELGEVLNRYSRAAGQTGKLKKKKKRGSQQRK